MRTSIVLSMAMALLWCAGSLFTPSHAQSPASIDTPTFYHLVPGTYVNAWPRFTVTYPKDWVEKRFWPGTVFWASAPGSAGLSLPAFGVVVGRLPVPLDKFSDFALRIFRNRYPDVIVVSDKPSQLRDGTPVREVERRMTINGVPCTWLHFATINKDNVLVLVMVIDSSKGKMGEDLRAIAYSLEFQPGFDEPVKVPPDVQAFIDQFRSDVVSHDVEKIMSHYSDRWLDSGKTKGLAAQLWSQALKDVTSYESYSIATTDFVAAGDSAYLAGVGTGYWGKTSFTGCPYFPVVGTSIVKEKGEWRWYGNQRDAVRWR